MSLSPLCHALTNDLHVSTVGPASTTVSHGFTVAWHSSPPFGSCRCVLALKTTSLGRELWWSLQTSPQGGSGHDDLSKPKDGPLEGLLSTDDILAFTTCTAEDGRRLRPGSIQQQHPLRTYHLRTSSRLLGPCFKTGSEGPLSRQIRAAFRSQGIKIGVWPGPVLDPTVKQRSTTVSQHAVLRAEPALLPSFPD